MALIVQRKIFAMIEIICSRRFMTNAGVYSIICLQVKIWTNDANGFEL